MENNILIAEFMGAKIKTSDQMASGVGGIDRFSTEMWYDFGRHNYGLVSSLQYHRSWDWLMPVVEKIETTVVDVPTKYRRGFMEGIEKAAVGLDTFYEEREEFKGWSWWLHFNEGNTIAQHNGDRLESKIEAVYNAVVEFIKWYNQNKTLCA